MPSPKNSFVVNHEPTVSRSESQEDGITAKSKWLSRTHFSGTLFINFIAFLIPALYGTLSKYWVSSIDTSMVVTVDAYTYIGVVAEVINEGLPRAAWLIIADNASRSMESRLGLSQTLIIFQASMGLIVSLIILGAATEFTAAFVPIEVRQTSLTYVRLSSFSVFSSSIEYATANATRALCMPDVPLVISIARFIVNIILDLLLISPFHIGTYKPSATLQAGIRLACDMTAALSGLAYFTFTVIQLKRRDDATTVSRPSVTAFLVLLRPGIMTFIESAVRNALYLWLVSNIVSMGSNYATAWGVFNTIRWGLVMVPVQTAEASSLAFTGRRWAAFRSTEGRQQLRPTANKQQLIYITAPASIACIIVLAVEIPLCILLSTVGAKPYARWISGSDVVAAITAHMWQTIDWCYIFYALSTQLATILLATLPKFYLYQSLVSNIFYVLPWAIVCQVKNLDANDAWTYHSVVFGGSLVFSFFDVGLFLIWWVYRLSRGKLNVDKYRDA